jgi:protein gp37
MWDCPQHTFQVLTKRPDRIPHATEEYWPSNLWLGVSIDGKTNGMNLIYDLFDSEFPFLRFVSFEPLLGPIQDLDLSCIQWVIIGAQTGPGATQPRKEWVEPIIAQTIENEIPLFIKNNLQWKGNTLRPHEFPKEVR